MTWMDCAMALDAVLANIRRVGYERAEVILLLARERLAARTGRPIRMRLGPRVKPRVGALHRRLRKELLELVKRDGAVAAAPVFSDLSAVVGAELRRALAD